MARGLIEDFTIFGAAFIMFISGLYVNGIVCSDQKKNNHGMFFLSLFFSVLFCSFAQNIINYNTILLSWIISLVLFFLRLNKAKRLIKLSKIKKMKRNLFITINYCQAELTLSCLRIFLNWWGWKILSLVLLIIVRVRMISESCRNIKAAQGMMLCTCLNRRAI